MHVTTIRPSRGWRLLDLAELWRYRELLFFLAWRDVKVRYKQTALGAGWAILQPALAMIIFSLFLGRLAQMPSDGIPYPLFAYTGLLPWTYFANAVTAAGSGLVTNANLVSKIYFPRLLIPVSAILAGLVDLAVGSVLLVVLLVFFGITPGPALVFIPLFVLLAILSAMAIGVWFSALDVQYRDIRHAMPFLVQIWLFATPVVYPVSLIPEAFRPLYGLNPMAGVIEGFRWALIGGTQPEVGLLLVSIVTTIFLLFGGILYFRRIEGTFADVI